jgi:glycerol uptake facilitator-like aquaporin
MMSRKIAAEFLGSLLLAAVVICSAIMGESLAAGNVAIALLVNAIATASILFVLIQALAPISGAHFNPAVSLVMALRRNLSAQDFLSYVFAQIAGCCAGVLLAHALFELPLLQVSDHVRAGPAQALSEGAATFALLLCILMAARHAPQAVPAAVALTIAAGYLWTPSTSFANPAITIARMLTDTFAGIRPADAPAFIAAQFGGALSAWTLCAWFYRAPARAAQAEIKAAATRSVSKSGG